MDSNRYLHAVTMSDRNGAGELGDRPHTRIESPEAIQSLSLALPPRHFGDSGAPAPVRAQASSV